MSNNTSQHILGTATNLLGFCLFVFTSLHISNFSETSIIDEFTAVIALLLICCCLLSFFSLKTTNPRREKYLEKIADWFFVSALLGILIVLILITFNLIN
ncbi:MAG: hypothetical protein WCH52_07305 [Bacteroidota bacterium]